MKYLQELNPFTKDSQSDFLSIKLPIIVKKDNDYEKFSLRGSRLDLILSETSEKQYYLSPKIDEIIRKALTQNNVIKGKYNLVEIYSMNLTVIGEINTVSNMNQKIDYDFDTEKKDYYIIEVDDNEKLIESEDKEYISKLYNYYKETFNPKEYPKIGIRKKEGEKMEYIPKYECDAEYKEYIDNLDIEEYINSIVHSNLTRDAFFRPDANLIFYEAELSEWGKPNYKRYKLDK